MRHTNESIFFDEKEKVFEKRENLKISIDFFFSAHGEREDFERVESLIKDADIIIPEQFGNTKESERAFNLISQGKINPDSFPESLKNSAQGFLLDSIYKTKKPILFVDIPKECVHLVEEKENELLQLFTDAHKFFQSGDFDNALKFIRLYINLKDQIDQIRDNYIVENILKICRKIEEDPEFKEKKIKILVCLGAMHTDVLHKINREENDLKTKMHTGKESGIVFSYLGEMYRRQRNNKESDNTIVARALIEEYVQKWIASFDFKIKNGLKKTEFIRTVSSLFSLDEIKEFSKDLSDLSKEDTDDLSLFLIRILKFVKILRRKGIEIKTEKDIDIFLKKYKK